MAAYESNCTTPCEAKALAHSSRALAAWKQARFGAMPIADAVATLEEYATTYEDSYVFEVLYGFFGRKERLMLAGETVTPGAEYAPWVCASRQISPTEEIIFASRADAEWYDWDHNL